MIRSTYNFYKGLIAVNRHWFKLVLNWFILAAIFGAITYFIKPSLLEDILHSYSDRFGDNPELNFSFALQIFLQNFTASLLALFGGILLGLGPFLVVAVNGFLIGFVVMSLFAMLNPLNAIVVVVLGLLPHGIIELPAFLITAAIGLRFGTQWLTKDSKGKRGSVLNDNFIQSFVYLPAIAFALFVAALIEVFVSGNLVGN